MGTSGTAALHRAVWRLQRGANGLLSCSNLRPGQAGQFRYGQGLGAQAAQKAAYLNQSEPAA